MSKPRRRKQKKQVKPELKLRQFAATELSDQLAALPCAADLPRFMVDTVAGAYAPADAELMIEGFGAAVTRPVTLRANTLKATAEDIAAALDAAGIAHNPVAWYPDAFILPEAQVSDLWDLDIYRDGKIYLQSLSSMMPPLVLGAQAGEDILDMCAAPGGKTTQIAALTGGRAMITACERNKMRAERLEYNVKKQGANRVTVMNMDARQLDDLFAFDRVLLDAPCSGSGTVTEGSRGQFSREYLDRTVKMQKTLLDKAIRLLKPGHEMVYSTCSVLREENEDVVAAALKKGGVELVPIDTGAFEGVPLLPTKLEGVMCVCPDEWYEGFFVAKLRKKAKK